MDGKEGNFRERGELQGKGSIIEEIVMTNISPDWTPLAMDVPALITLPCLCVLGVNRIDITSAL